MRMRNRKGEGKESGSNIKADFNLLKRWTDTEYSVHLNMICRRVYSYTIKEKTHVSTARRHLQQRREGRKMEAS